MAVGGELLMFSSFSSSETPFALKLANVLDPVLSRLASSLPTLLGVDVDVAAEMRGDCRHAGGLC